MLLVMAGLSIDINTKELNDLLDAIIDAGGDLEVPIRRSLTAMLRSFDRTFRAQGRPSRWAPWSPRTELKRPGGRILQDTGTLRASVSTEGSPGSVFRTSNTVGEAGSALVYAATHQFGRGAIPARPFIVVQDEDEKRIRLIFEDYFATITREQGG